MSEYSLRSIAFLAELVHEPHQHDPKDLQKIHSLAFGDDNCKYQNFSLTPGGATLSNPQSKPNEISSAVFLPDRIQLREEMSGISRESFRERVARLSGFSIDVLGVQQFSTQNFVVRSLVNTRNFYDSKEFISRSLLNMEEEDFSCLQRHPQIVGLRLVFPQTSDNRGMFNIRVESYAADSRSLFIENVGVFQSVINQSNLSDLTSNFFATYDYVDGNIVNFISQFDAPEELPPA